MVLLIIYIYEIELASHRKNDAISQNVKKDSKQKHDSYLATYHSTKDWNFGFFASLSQCPGPPYLLAPRYRYGLCNPCAMEVGDITRKKQPTENMTTT